METKQMTYEEREAEEKRRKDEVAQKLRAICAVKWVQWEAKKVLVCLHHPAPEYKPFMG